MRLRFRFEIKRALIAGVCILLTVFGSLRVPEVPLKFALVMSVLFAATACLRLEVRGWWATLVMGLFACGTALLTVLLCQFVNDMRGVPKSAYLIFLGCMCFLLLAVIFQLLVLCFSRISIRPVAILLSAALLVLAVANRFTYEYRGMAMTPIDLLGLRTAFNIVGNYRLYIDKNTWYTIILFVLLILCAAAVHAESFPRIALRRGLALLAALGIGLFVRSALQRIEPSYWNNFGTQNNGFLVNFSRELLDSLPAPPEGYGISRIEALEQQYGAADAESKTVPETLPHIIVVMNESFTDFRVFGEMETSEPVMPFLDSLQENTIRGYALSSVYGGKTPNSEYEFLTGNSVMLFSSPSAIPFSGIKKPVYSLERYLKSLGYASYATHPEKSSTWARDTVYPQLGFARSTFRESYPEAETIMNWVKDEEVYDNIIREFETGEQDAPRFLYAVTSQNHGPYAEEDEGIEMITLKGYNSGELASYFGRLHESDRAFRKLVEYFEQVDEPVVILMFGDHHPREETQMIRFLHGKDLESLDEQQLMYEIPYFIWANFDIEERRPELTSINYLSNDLLEAAGLPLSPYNRFLKDVQETIPAINAFGYYSRSEGRFQTLEEARGEEAQALLDYETLQYNAVNDKKGRSEFFFPVGD